MRKTQIPFEPVDEVQGQSSGSSEHQEPGEAVDGVGTMGKRGVNGGFLIVEGEKCGCELDTWRESRSWVEYGEEGRVSEEEFGGRGGEVEAGFEKRSEGEREGFGFGGIRLRLKQDLVLEGEGLMEIFLSFDGEV